MAPSYHTTGFGQWIHKSRSLPSESRADINYKCMATGFVVLPAQAVTVMMGATVILSLTTLVLTLVPLVIPILLVVTKAMYPCQVISVLAMLIDQVTLLLYVMATFLTVAPKEKIC